MRRIKQQERKKNGNKSSRIKGTDQVSEKIPDIAKNMNQKDHSNPGQ
jgi:hypothetical protein